MRVVTLGLGCPVTSADIFANSGDNSLFISAEGCADSSSSFFTIGLILLQNRKTTQQLEHTSNTCTYSFLVSWILSAQGDADPNLSISFGSAFSQPSPDNCKCNIKVRLNNTPTLKILLLYLSVSPFSPFLSFLSFPPLTFSSRLCSLSYPFCSSF